jgi:type VI secretion system protein ImpM
MPVGLFGKLPARGDFLRRGLPAGLTAPLDAWLQAALAASRAALGEGWPALWLESPIWRFAAAAGVCGPVPAAGILLPSTDRVGRCFPLVLAAPLPAATALPDLLRGAEAWYARLEAAALDLLDETAAVETLEAALAAIGEPPLPDGNAPRPDLRLPLPENGPLQAPAAWDLAGLALLGSLWWSPQGAPRVAPSLLACAGLPRPAGFAAMLDGDWTRWGWSERR